MIKIFNKESLERFIKEQTQGPGIGGYRFVNLASNWHAEKNLYTEVPINNNTEILNTMPASLYSTGILFPKDGSDSADIGVQDDTNTSEDDLEEDSEQLKNNTEDVESESSFELNQMFPQTMGLTFCMKEDFLKAGILNFNISCRYYRKLEKNDLDKIGVLCEVNSEALNKFIMRNGLSNYLSIVDLGVNKVLKATRRLSNEDVKVINQILRSINQEKSEEIFKRFQSYINYKNSVSNLSSLIQIIFTELKKIKEQIRKQEKNSTKLLRK